MQEYASPDVCVEESESGSKYMEGMAPDTAGSIIPRVRGPDNETSQIMTN